MKKMDIDSVLRVAERLPWQLIFSRRPTYNPYKRLEEFAEKLPSSSPKENHPYISIAQRALHEVSERAKGKNLAEALNDRETAKQIEKIKIALELAESEGRSRPTHATKEKGQRGELSQKQRAKKALSELQNGEELK